MDNGARHKIWGLISSVIGLILLLAIVNSGNNTPISKWPKEGFHNLAFSIGWLSPFPDWLTYLVALLTIFLVMWIFYKIGQWLSKKFT